MKEILKMKCQDKLVNKSSILQPARCSRCPSRWFAPLGGGTDTCCTRRLL